MAKAENLTYTENEVAAIAVLREHVGEPMSAKDLGIATAVLTSLIRKSEKFPEDPNVVFIDKTDYNAVCSQCGAKISHKLYCIRG